jgi:hypothetical protein
MTKTVIIATCTIFLLMIPCIVHGAIYKWTDEKGTVHFTDDESTIPAEYRQQVENIVLPEGSKFITEGGEKGNETAGNPTAGSLEQDVSLWLSGVINRTDAGTIVVTVEGKDIVFFVSSTTRIQTGDGKNVSFGELKKGRPVTIEYIKQGDDNVARSIKVTIVQERAPVFVEDQVGGAGQMQDPSDVQKRVWEDTKTHQAPRLPQLPKK